MKVVSVKVAVLLSRLVLYNIYCVVDTAFPRVYDSCGLIFPGQNHGAVESNRAPGIH